MPTSTSIYDQAPSAPRHAVKEEHIKYDFIGKLQGLKYEYRPDIRDRATLERNFREKFEALNRVKLTNAEFERLLEEIVTPDVFTAAQTLRTRNSFNLSPTLIAQYQLQLPDKKPIAAKLHELLAQEWGARHEWGERQKVGAGAEVAVSGVSRK